MILTLHGAYLWLWNFLGPIYDCEISSCLSDCETSWCFLMSVALPAAHLWLWHFFWPLWLWHFLGPLYDSGHSRNLTMIVKRPGASLWSWNFLRPFYDFGTSWGLSIIVTPPGSSVWLWHFLGPPKLWHMLGPLWMWHFMGPPNNPFLGSEWFGHFVWSLWLLDFLWPRWLWHFLGPLHDWDTSWGISMIMAPPVASGLLVQIIWTNQCLPETRIKLIYRLILGENQLKLVSRS